MGGMALALEARRVQLALEAFKKQNKRCFDCGSLVRYPRSLRCERQDRGLACELGTFAHRGATLGAE